MGQVLFRTALPLSVTRLWPAPGVLALELRDLAARTVEFRVLAAADGRELFRYHDPAAPWWLALAGCTPAALRLAELDPARLGLPRGFREVPLPVPVGGASETDKATENQPSTTAAAWQTPVAYAAGGPHFAPLRDAQAG